MDVLIMIEDDGQSKTAKETAKKKNSKNRQARGDGRSGIGRWADAGIAKVRHGIERISGSHRVAMMENSVFVLTD